MTVEKESSFVAQEFWTPQRKAGSASGQRNEQVFKPTLVSVSPLEMRLQTSTSQGHYEGNANSICTQCLPVSPSFHLHLSCTSILILLSLINSIPEERKNYIQMIGSHHIHCYSFSCSMVWLLVLSLLVNSVHTPVLQFCHLLPITLSKN